MGTANIKCVCIYKLITDDNHLLPHTCRGRLLSIINTKLSENSPVFPSLLRDHGFSDAADVANHLLLFTSALVPKGLASLLTSFILATAGNVSKISYEILLINESELH